MKKKLITIFKKVQKIPYKVCKFDKEKINENLKFGDCRHKSFLLKSLLEKEGFEVKEIKVIFDWKDLPLPKEIISILKKSSTVWVHDALKVKVNNKWIKVDPTWNIELEKKGFPVTKNWNGKTDTAKITNGKLKFIDNDKYNKKIKIDPTEARIFAKKLNEFLFNHKNKEEDWYEILSKIMNPTFSKSQYQRYLKRHKEKLRFYKKYIPGKKVLDLGCGFGYASAPLSNLGFEVIAVDNNPRVIEAIKENARKYRGKIKIIKEDIFNLKKIFKKNSFDACISGGLLEHFNKKKIRELIKIQLFLAPIAIADVPIHSNKKTLKKRYKNFQKKICLDGVFRNLWGRETWINKILKGFNVIYSKVGISSKDTGAFEKLTLVIRR